MSVRCYVAEAKDLSVRIPGVWASMLADLNVKLAVGRWCTHLANMWACAQGFLCVVAL